MSTKQTGTIILKCTCNHEFQDKQYGLSMRVHNWTGGGKSGQCKPRCTVCSNTK